MSDSQWPVPGRPGATEHPPGSGQWDTHRLVIIATRLTERRINRQLSHLQLSASSLDALATVAELEPTTATIAAALMCVSAQSLGKVLRRLEQLGLLIREQA